MMIVTVAITTTTTNMKHYTLQLAGRSKMPAVVLTLMSLTFTASSGISAVEFSARGTISSRAKLGPK